MPVASALPAPAVIVPGQPSGHLLQAGPRAELPGHFVALAAQRAPGRMTAGQKLQGPARRKACGAVQREVHPEVLASGRMTGRGLEVLQNLAAHPAPMPSRDGRIKGRVRRLVPARDPLNRGRDPVRRPVGQGRGRVENLAGNPVSRLLASGAGNRAGNRAERNQEHDSQP